MVTMTVRDCCGMVVILSLQANSLPGMHIIMITITPPIIGWLPAILTIINKFETITGSCH